MEPEAPEQGASILDAGTQILLDKFISAYYQSTGASI